MSIHLTVYRCQKCGFLFERRGEPEACPKCGHGFVLPQPEQETAEPQEAAQPADPAKV